MRMSVHHANQVSSVDRPPVVRYCVEHVACESCGVFARCVECMRDAAHHVSVCVGANCGSVRDSVLGRFGVVFAPVCRVWCERRVGFSSG